jgi:phage baseplate assembly protein W|tara:strand:- start:623 stop:1024 length:402 start_codon:yes stop_codon:yes gene_type:complete
VPLERVSQGFKDISMSFKINPLNDDLIALKNASAISRSIRNIVFTVPGEKFFQEDFGSDISQSLFENFDDLTATTIRDQIESSIERFEPRVNLRNVKVNPNFDQNLFNVIIVYDIVGADIPPQELQFVLQSNR